MITLKNNHTTSDPRLDRIPHFDDRSRRYGISEIIKPTKKPRSYTWSCGQHLDQGNQGACVGFGISHELIARPVPVNGLDAKFAKEKIYWPAQENDPWPGGSYPHAFPFYEGTNVLYGLKEAISIGYADSFSWAFGLEDLIVGVGYNGPAVLGINWYEGMSTPDAKGIIHTKGQKAGGHCILCKGVNIKGEYFTLHNSWGESWGVGGDCFISFADMKRLLYEEGEAAFFVGRHANPGR